MSYKIQKKIGQNTSGETRYGKMWEDMGKDHYTDPG